MRGLHAQRHLPLDICTIANTIACNLAHKQRPPTRLAAQGQAQSERARGAKLIPDVQICRTDVVGVLAT
jgi:hypothetical protein